jgi:Icc-related predicted phosphoesterase
MFIRLLSDLHLEFTFNSHFELPLLPEDSESVLVLAGDIGVEKSKNSFKKVEEWAKMERFKKIIHICGNHEYYGGSMLRVRAKLQERFKHLPNIVMAQNDQVVRVDNVSFICSTLWTNYDRGNPMFMQIVRGALNDYKYIRTGNPGHPYIRKINPKDLFFIHHQSQLFVFDNIPIEKAAGQKVVVVTHHGPTRKSIHERYGLDPVNWGYVSELNEGIMDTQPQYWLHGHTHDSFDYMVENTHVLTNPMGYVKKMQFGYGEPEHYVPENAGFNPSFRFEV